MDSGNGPALKDACPCLRDDNERRERVIDVKLPILISEYADE